jgi:hypothetical protein
MKKSKLELRARAIEGLSNLCRELLESDCVGDMTDGEILIETICNKFSCMFCESCDSFSFESVEDESGDYICLDCYIHQADRAYDDYKEEASLNE